ncbi:MAG TPA: hypothetical protein VF116_17555 [Ktedonobacterales bacterium]
MNSRTIEPFWKLYAALPRDIQRLAGKAFVLFEADPGHPSLQFKVVNERRRIWSARITDDYRVLGFRDGADMTWFFIGSHADYDQILRRFR